MAITRLRQIAETLNGGGVPDPVTTRTFLWWFGAQRRGFWIVQDIRNQLKEVGIKTEPDFESAYIDAPIAFALEEKTSKKPPRGPNPPAAEPEQATSPDTAEDTAALIREDPTYRISKLSAANQPITSVKPDASREAVVTLLLARGFGQIPVMTSDREVKGVVSWRSISTRTHFNSGATTAKDLMDPHHEVSSDCSMFDAIPIIDENNYVLVRAPDKTYSGIITSSDMNKQFQALTEPFLLIGEIENLLRIFIDDKFDSAALVTALQLDSEQSQIAGARDLTFGHYVRLIENPDHWPKLGIPVDRSVLAKDMDRVREIRNDVMHFDPDGVLPEDLEFLRRTTAFMKSIRRNIHG